MSKQNWILLSVIIIALIGAGIFFWKSYKTNKIVPKAAETTPVLTQEATAHLFINGVDKGIFVENSIGTAGQDLEFYQATWTTTTNQWVSQGNRTGTDAFTDARQALRAQNPEVKFFTSANKVLGTAHLYINGVDKGKFIETSIGSTENHEQNYEATWTTDTDQWVDEGDISVDTGSINEARRILKAQNPEVKVIATDGTIKGVAELFINDVDKGKFIETSIGLSSGDQRVYEATWTSDTNQWVDQSSLAPSDESSAIEQARTALRAQKPEIRVSYKATDNEPDVPDEDTDTDTSPTQTQSQSQSQSQTSTTTSDQAQTSTSTATTTTGSATTGPELPIAGGGILGILILARYLINRRIGK